MSMGLVAVVGYLLERVAYRPLRGANRLAAVVSALGASIFFSNAIMLVYGARSQVYPNGILPSVAVSLLGVDIPLMRIVMFVGTVVLMLLLYWFINHTRIGTAIRRRRHRSGHSQAHGHQCGQHHLDDLPHRPGARRGRPGS